MENLKNNRQSFKSVKNFETKNYKDIVSCKNLNGNNFDYPNIVPVIPTHPFQQNEKVMIVKKLEWTNELIKQVEDEFYFNDPKNYFKEERDLILNHRYKGPNIGNNSSKNIIIKPFEIVGKVEDFYKSIPGISQKKNNKQSKKKNLSSIKMSSTNFIGKKTVSNNSTYDQNNDYNSNDIRAFVDEDTLNKLFKKLKDRVDFNQQIENNEIERVKRAKKRSMGIKIKKERSKNVNQEENELKDFLNTNTDSDNSEKNDGNFYIENDLSNFSNLKAQSGKSIFQKTAPVKKNGLLAHVESYLKQDKKKVEKKEEKLKSVDVSRKGFEKEDKIIEELRDELESQQKLFVKKIYGNRLPVTINSEIPINYQADMSRQTNTLEYRNDVFNKTINLGHHISKKIKQDEKKLLINTTDESRWREEIKKFMSPEKKFEEKLGPNHWMASLRKPSDFKGERKSFYNCKERWFEVKEKNPDFNEIIIPSIIVENQNDEDLDIKLKNNSIYHQYPNTTSRPESPSSLRKINKKNITTQEANEEVQNLMKRIGFKSMNFIKSDMVQLPNYKTFKPKKDESPLNSIKVLGIGEIDMNKFSQSKEIKDKILLLNNKEVALTNENKRSSELNDYYKNCDILKKKEDEERKKGIQILGSPDTFNFKLMKDIYNENHKVEIKNNNYRHTFLNIDNEALNKIAKNDDKKIKQLNKMVEMSKIRLEGKSIIDLEIKAYKSIKGNKILYNKNINPGTQKEIYPEDKSEVVFKVDYDNSSKYKRPENTQGEMTLNYAASSANFNTSLFSSEFNSTIRSKIGKTTTTTFGRSNRNSIVWN